MAKPKKRVPHHGTPPGKATMAGANGNGRIGNPPFEATDEQRAEVKTLAKVISVQMIADMLGIPKITLYRHFRSEIAEGKREAAMRVGSMILTKALGGNLTAAIFYAKTQLGWHERYEVDDDPEGLKSADNDPVLQTLIKHLVGAAKAKKGGGGGAPPASGDA